MKLFKNFKPRKIEAPAKNALMSKITAGASYCIGTYGTGYFRGGLNSKTFIVFNCHKVRRKRGIRASHWIAYVYEFDEEVLKALDIRVIQNPRNFEIRGK